MNIPVLVFPSGFHLVLSQVATFRYEDCEDNESFDFVYTKAGVDKEFRERVPIQFKVLLNQKINYIFDVAEIKKK